LDNVVTSVLVFEGEGRITEYTGGYEDWIRQRDAKPVHFREILAEPKPESKPAPSSGTRQEKGPKFLKREQRELEELPAQIEKMEEELSALNARLWDPAIYQKQPENVSQLKTELAALEERIKNGYARWEQLEARRKASEGEGV
jgi:ATP-binding cassette subfamily F protein uup